MLAIDDHNYHRAASVHAGMTCQSSITRPVGIGARASVPACPCQHQKAAQPAAWQRTTMAAQHLVEPTVGTSDTIVITMTCRMHGRKPGSEPPYRLNLPISPPYSITPIFSTVPLDNLALQASSVRFTSLGGRVNMPSALHGSLVRLCAAIVLSRCSALFPLFIAV